MQHAILLGILELFIKYLRNGTFQTILVFYISVLEKFAKNLILEKICIMDPYTKLITLKN